MNKIALVYSLAKSRSLPPDKRPLCHRVTGLIYHDAFELAGAASLCWDEKPKGTFNSDRAVKFVTDFLFTVAEELERLGVTFDQLNQMPEEIPAPATCSTDCKDAAPTIEADYARENIRVSKELRRDLDVQLQKLKHANRKSPERQESIRKMQEAIMWLGMDLKSISESMPDEARPPTPYPKSYDPSSPVVEPTADGLKL